MLFIEYKIDSIRKCFQKNISYYKIGLKIKLQIFKTHRKTDYLRNIMKNNQSDQSH